MRVLLTICLLALAAATWAGVAHAQVIEGTSGGDVLVGTVYADKMYGHGGADTVRGKRGNDLLKGQDGADTLECGFGYDSPVGGDGEDLIFCDQDDGKPDVIDCGPRDDIVFWRVPGTVILDNCESAFHVTGTGDATRG